MAVTKMDHVLFSEPDMVQCASIWFFPPTSQNHVAASRLLVGAAPHSHLSSAWELFGRVPVSDVLGTMQQLCSMGGCRAGTWGWVGDGNCSALRGTKLHGPGTLGDGIAASSRRPSKVS